jgi:hypothetical protein
MAIDPPENGISQRSTGSPGSRPDFDLDQADLSPPRSGRRISFVAWGAAGVVGIGLWALIFKVFG